MDDDVPVRPAADADTDTDMDTDADMDTEAAPARLDRAREELTAAFTAARAVGYRRDSHAMDQLARAEAAYQQARAACPPQQVPPAVNRR